MAAAFGVVGYTFVMWWFRDGEPNLDDLGLFNPIYTYLKTGHMTYPVYNMYSNMVVHPPTHYLLVAWTMRLTGLTAEAAALLPPILWLAVGAIALAGSRLSIAAKYGLLFGALVGLVFWAPPVFIRPDVEEASAWLAGLLVLEAARNGGWDLPRVFLGSALLGLASALHYPYSASVLGVVVFGALAVREHGWRRSGRVLLVLAAGSCAVLIPYLVLFIIPDWSAISAFTHQVNGKGSLFAGFDATRSAYEHFYYGPRYGGSFLAHLASPITRFGIPAVFVTTPLFAIRRETRGIALASAPQLLFMLFYSRAKTFYYFTPEFSLYFALLGYMSLLAVMRIVRLARAGGAAVLTAATVAAAILFAAPLAYARPAIAYLSPLTPHPLHEDMDIARAAGMAMLPSDPMGK